MLLDSLLLDAGAKVLKRKITVLLYRLSRSFCDNTVTEGSAESVQENSPIS